LLIYVRLGSFLVFCIIAVFSAAIAAVASDTRTSSAEQIGAYADRLTASPVWTTARWTGDERPLLLARAEVDRYAGAPDFAKRVGYYGETAHLHPNDPVAVFTWAYAGWLLAVQSHCATVLSDNADTFFPVVQNQALSTTYNGARIRFLWESPVCQYEVRQLTTLNSAVS